MDKTISWLHISDLHLFDEIDTVLNIENYESLSKVIHPSFIIVTGDFRHKKLCPSFESALNYLNRLVEIFRLNKNAVFMVPGNHDVNDYPTREEIIKRISSKLSIKTPDYNEYQNYMTEGEDCLLNGFTEYEEFVREFYNGSDVTGDRVDNPASTFCSCWNNCINIIHINSALISNGERHPDGTRTHKDIVDLTSLKNCNIKDPELPTIAICHSSHEDIDPAFVQRMAVILNKHNVQAYFHGDVHRMDIQFAPGIAPLNKQQPISISGAKSAPQSGDDYSDIGTIYYTWHPTSEKVEIQAYTWNIEGFKPSNKFMYDVNKKMFFYLRKNIKKTMLKQTDTQPLVSNVEIQPNIFVDKLALEAYNQNKTEEMVKAIMMGADIYQNCKPKQIRQKLLNKYCNFIICSSALCPLIIKGLPGTGKSTLLSLFYLQLQQEFNGGTFLFDLHVFDNVSKKCAAAILNDSIVYIEKLLSQNQHTLLFVDGINLYKRHYTDLEERLLKQIRTWQETGSVKVVYSIGIQDSKQYPPFERFVKYHSITAETTLKLLPIGINSPHFAYMLTTILELKSLNAIELRGKLKTYCGMIDNEKSTIRTIWFLVNQYVVLGNSLFTTPVGKLLYEYYENAVGIKRMKTIANSVAGFLLERKSATNTPNVVALKGPAIMDFFFSYYYIESCTEAKNNDYIKSLDFIFTSRINRFVVQIAQLNAKQEERFILTLIRCYDDSLPFNTKIQIAYFLGRVKESQRAKNNATKFLASEYKKLRECYNKSQKKREEVMLLRTIGISLLYLGYSNHDEDFYSLIIYDEAMNRINRDFHIAYYTTNSYKLTDKNVFKKDIIYDLNNIKQVYSFLFHSVEKAQTTDIKCINIITIISLVVYWKYGLRSNGHTIEAFRGFDRLLTSLSTDQSIPDVIHDYILTTQRNLKKAFLYENLLAKLYGFKRIMRQGWLAREINRNSNVRIESDAEHTWACCILADILLPENIYDCELISDGVHDFERYSGYNKQKVISILLVHDLPECITGDISTPNKTYNDKENEIRAINSIRALGAFPGLSALYDVADECKAFLSRDDKYVDINIQIASDIDRLEPLIQLYFYRKWLGKPYDYSEVAAWERKPEFRIHTSFGNKLLDLLKKYYLNEECFQRGDEEYNLPL